MASSRKLHVIHQRFPSRTALRGSDRRRGARHVRRGLQSARAHCGALGLALVAFVYFVALMSAPTNDNFMHMALARQVVGGDVPVRDFFDSGVVLMYLLSALAEAAVGYRLLSEALIVGVVAASSVLLIYSVTWRLTGSRLAAALAAVLLILAGPRGYSYPKLIVYAGAAALWWGYVSAPNRRRLLALGAWTAVAFYWRPDHGAYVAIGVALATAAAHGISRSCATACATAGSITLALVLPFLAFVHLSLGLPQYVATGYAQGQYEHVKEDHAVPKWPVRSWADVVGVSPPEDHAPTVNVRWAAATTTARRQAALAEHQLASLGAEDPLTERVRLADPSPETIRSLVADSAIEDTSGIDRAAASLPTETWSTWERWRFGHVWLRVKLLPGLDDWTRAGEAVAALFYVLPVALLLVAASPLRRHLPGVGSARHLSAFAAFGLVVDVGVLRTPYEIRAVDGVVLPAILFGCALVVLVRAARERGTLGRVLLLGAAGAVALLVTKGVAVAGEFGDRTDWLAGGWSVRRSRGVWTDVGDRLWASPPVTYWTDRPAPASLRLAHYAHECVPPSDRLLVMWFAPDIYFYADRLMAHRHVVFVPQWSALDYDDERTLAKLTAYPPPIALATRETFEADAQASNPRVVEYLRQDYDVAGSLNDEDREFLVLVRRGRQPVRSYGDDAWPCFVSPPQRPATHSPDGR